MKVDFNKIIISSSILFFILMVSCDTREVKNDVTKELLQKNIEFSDDSDMFSINQVVIYNADKRVYEISSHSQISLAINIRVKNNSVNDLSIFTEDLTIDNKLLPCFTGHYNGYVIHFFNVKSDEVITLLPGEEQILHLSTSLLFGSVFLFESLFGLKEDYTPYMVDLISEIRYFYNSPISDNNLDSTQIRNIPIKINRNIKVNTVDTKDGVFDYWYNRYKGNSYPIMESQSP